MGLSNSDAKKIAYYLNREFEANKENSVSEEENPEVAEGINKGSSETENKKLVGFFRITLSHAGWWLVHNYKKLFLALFLILLLYLLFDLFGIWLIVFFVAISIFVTALLFIVRQKDRVYVIEVKASPSSQDSFNVWSMSHHRFNEYKKEGNVNPIDTGSGLAYIVEEIDRKLKTMKMSYRHTNLDFWIRKQAFLDLKEKAISIGDTLDKTTLLKDYDVHVQSRNKANRVLAVINEALFPDKKSYSESTQYKKFLAEVKADVKKYKEEKKLD